MNYPGNVGDCLNHILDPKTSKDLRRRLYTYRTGQVIILQR